MQAQPTLSVARSVIAVSALLALIRPCGAEAQSEYESIVIGRTITIRSTVLNEDRRINIQLPQSYGTEPDVRYPVLFLLDGGAPGPFVYVAGLAGFLAAGSQIPEMIVVGIPNTSRSRDLSPAREKPWWYRNILLEPDSVLHPIESQTVGGADAFLRFLTDELTPEIERRYRTAPFRVLMGHSLGGLFVTHTVLTRPESFHGYVASSPTLIWDDRALVRNARSAVARIPDASRFFFLGVGDREEVLLKPVGELATVLELAAPPALRWWYRVMPNRTHQSNPIPTYAQALSTIFADVAIPEGFAFTGDIAALEAKFARASSLYGFVIVPPAAFISVMGMTQLQLGRGGRAVEILERGVQLHPASAAAWDALAGALESSGRIAEALQKSEEAVRQGRAIAHPQLDAFTRRRDALRQKLGR